MSEENNIPQPNLDRRQAITSSRIAKFVYDEAAKDAYIEDLLEVIAQQKEQIAALTSDRQDHAPLTVLKDS